MVFYLRIANAAPELLQEVCVAVRQCESSAMGEAMVRQKDGELDS